MFDLKSRLTLDGSSSRWMYRLELPAVEDTEELTGKVRNSKTEVTGKVSIIW